MHPGTPALTPSRATQDLRLSLPVCEVETRLLVAPGREAARTNETQHTPGK